MELGSHKYLWVIIFMIFAPTVCNRHTITFCMPGRGYSVDGVATCYRLDRFEPQFEKEIFYFSYLSGPALGPTELCLQREMALFPGSTGVRAGADHPLQTSAGIKNQYSYTTAPSMGHHWHDMD